MKNLKPVKLVPAFKDYMWGGTKLKEKYNKKSDLDIVAESWELSTHKDGESIISGGEFDGLTLSQYIEKNGREILGKNALKFDYFPILIKFIDAKKSLSVQVHPDDEYALKNEGEYGKTEMWYILEAEEGAFIYYGFRENLTKEEFESHIKNNTLTDVLKKVEVKKGNAYFIPSGTVHAIGEGIVICEIQQNSNTTYRVYDFNRKDAMGNTRPLHIEKSIETATTSPAPEQKEMVKLGEGDYLLSSCEYFTVRKLLVEGEMEIEIDDISFNSIVVTEGEGKMIVNDSSLDIKKGDSVFVPAMNGKIHLIGNLDIILSRV